MMQAFDVVGKHFSGVALPNGDLELCRRIERAEMLGLRGALEHGQAMFPDRGIAIEEFAGGIIGYGGDGSPFNQLVGIQRELQETDIDAIVQFYFGRASPAVVSVSPLAGPNTPARLAERGFEMQECESALIADLRRSPGARDARVELCSDPTAWAEHSATTFAEGYPSEPLAFISFLLASDPRVTPLVIRENDVIVSTSCLARERDGIASLFADATSPWCRRRGFQSVMIADRMARAVEYGVVLARAGAKQGTPSERNYLRNGFEAAYTRTSWILPP